MSRPETKASSYGWSTKAGARGGLSGGPAFRDRGGALQRLHRREADRGRAGRAAARGRRSPRTSSSIAVRGRWRSPAWRARWPTRASSTASSAWARSSAGPRPLRSGRHGSGGGRRRADGGGQARRRVRRARLRQHRTGGRAGGGEGRQPRRRRGDGRRRDGGLLRAHRSSEEGGGGGARQRRAARRQRPTCRAASR